MGKIIEPFSTNKCELGESPVWSAGRNSFLWLDILNKTLLEKYLDSSPKPYDNKWRFQYTPSLVLTDTFTMDRVYMIAEDGIHHFDLHAHDDNLICPLSLPVHYRTNDGSVGGGDGTIYFGSMQRQPDGKNGNLFSFTSHGALKELPLKIGIPNTFVWIDANSVAISDSFDQTVGLYKSDDKGFRYIKQLYDFSRLDGEPDGGAIDNEGMIWLALWGAGKIVRLDPSKRKLTHEIDLPVSKPSSCCFGGKDMNYLFVTSAADDCKPENTLDGMSFVIKMDVSGEIKKGFSLCQ